ncbi:MAG: cytochrome c4 [Betaproteobacteria bacterium]|nr:cytochrome c4 [Betaproteobacteria bacterium]
MESLRAFACAVIAAACSTASAAGNPEAGEKKAAACIACHGPDGNSPALPEPAEPWPKLAGQLPEYMTKQLHDFKAGRRTNSQMSPQAQALAESDIPDIVAFFAKQKIKSNEPADKSVMAQGEKLFFSGKGRPEPVVACVGCHGLNGVGNKNWNKSLASLPAVLAPAIGGQHASYVARQLKAYRDGTRKNDASNTMRDIARRLTDKDIVAIAEYVASLPR